MMHSLGIVVVFFLFKLIFGLSKDLCSQYFDVKDTILARQTLSLCWFRIMLYLFVSSSLQPLGLKYLMDHDPLEHLGCDHFSPRPKKASNQILAST